MSEPSPTPRLAPPPDRVSIAALTLQDLRNHAALEAAFDAPLIVLTGENGAGKTNLLEAISLLAPGRGLRRAAFDDITRHGAAHGWAVGATILRNGEEARIATGLFDGTPGEGGARKVRVNGAPAATADALFDYIRVLWLTPAMDGLFLGPASERRRFLDRLVLTLDATHGRRTRDFERLLTQRNRLLDEGGSAAWLDAVEAQLAGYAVAVALARAETAALLSAAHGRRRAPRPSRSDRSRWRASSTRRSPGARRARRKSGIARRLPRTARADRAAARTLLGPHRSDLDVVFAEKNMPAALSSTGEQKALLIGLVLSHAELVARDRPA